MNESGFTIAKEGLQQVAIRVRVVSSLIHVEWDIHIEIPQYKSVAGPLVLLQLSESVEELGVVPPLPPSFPETTEHRMQQKEEEEGEAKQSSSENQELQQ